ncbi:Rieske 2Fe-2S domain-containing protein [Fictibacillus terranigra]|uniref:Rieske 2Fe-2S domain-containing protein n=1 Tax=Fictibacillus terranigra TaxID=3058424 RepID=A0ABT8EC19_9BACL|nr:Rieske 2Fe-2S domain-containing protein [Fictibacillus sp. CENA-BCM004]MDN4075394.1 Rieske 2Fe-2S domain-containing protein [Fictibacillus sp. CENA-BCM004]
MLSSNENDVLTRTGPDSPMGKMLRQYWIPALLAEELPEPDCPPVRVKLLGEELIAFRDTNGKLGIVDEYCPHRKVSLFYGRNEECGLRCAYHGWKFDTQGNCIDLPSEPTESKFKNKVKIKSYSCEERGGVIWAYMGPPDSKPELPEQEWMLVSDSQRYLSKKVQECNYFQGLEGGIDSSHVSILHSGSVGGLGVSKKSNSTTLLAKDTAPRFEVADTDYGLLIGARRNADQDNFYWRITQFLMPWYTMIPPFGGAPRGGHAWVPIDDENCWVWSWSWTPDRDLTEEEIKQMQSGAGIHPSLIPGTFRTKANKENDFLIDREMQKRGDSFAGIFGVGMEDHAVQVSAGAIVDRSQEKLGTSDTAIIKARQCLLKAVKMQEKGEKLPALDPSSHRIRSASVLLPKGMPFQEGAKAALELTEKDFAAV